MTLKKAATAPAPAEKTHVSGPTPPRSTSASLTEVDWSARIDDQFQSISQLLAEPRKPFFPDHLVSVVIPAFNEEKTILTVIANVLRLPLNLDVIVVDDCSQDETSRLLRIIDGLPNITVIRKPKNEGKGAALRSGFQIAQGDFVVIQDADLEYNTSEITALLMPLVHGNADVVYGSRFVAGSPAGSSWLHVAGNRLLTSFSNQVNGLELTDMETCYKAFARWTLDSIEVKEDRFGFEPEVTAKLARLGARFAEMPVSYEPRSWKEGKKIGVKDLIRTLYCIARYRWLN